jgi:hypothetical protein
MSRGLSTAVKTQLASGSFVMAHLVSITLGTVASPNVYYYTDGAENVTLDGNLYLANGFFLGVDAVTEDSNMNIGSLTLRLSGVNQTIISDALNNGHLHREVIVTRFLWNTAGAVMGSFQIYTGKIESMAIGDSGDTSQISFGVANHWADFGRREGRITNEKSQQHYFAGDLCFEFAHGSDKKFKWGGVIEAPPPGDSDRPAGGDPLYPGSR